ncbi:tetratricopeptide repeat protein [Hydrogenophaga sp. RWCD_12]|uniref:tetratricopeptide repeat protein n=1 Tax=Hydrogenophaga sp. RWCD_12 TaxID=3391190 RepID=UPI0039849B5D
MSTHNPSSTTSTRTRDTRSAPKIPPFWHRLNAFFLFPFQARPLMYAVFLSLCSLTVMVSELIGFFVVIGILLATARYSFKVSAMASMGVLNSSDYDNARSDPAWTNLPWKFLGVLLVHGFVISLLMTAGEGLGDIGRLISSLLVPATLMVLIQTTSFLSAINPSALLRAIAAVGMPYLLLCVFMLLLSTGMPVAWGLLLPLAPKGLIAPVMAFVLVYFSWVTASMVGYVMFQNHENLDIDLVQDPSSELIQAGQGARRSGPVVDPVVRERDAQVAALIKDGSIKEAHELAYDWQRANPESLNDQRRYHRVLLLTDKKDTLAWFTQKVIQSLMKEQKGQEALQVYAATLPKCPELSLESAELTLTLAQLAWKGLDHQQALALLKGFDKRYPRDPAVPKAYELIARVLHQGLGRTEQALAVYRAMAKHFPQHPSTQEAAWLLREHTGAVAGAT